MSDDRTYRIRKARMAADLTHKELAAKTGLTISRMVALEKDEQVLLPTIMVGTLFNLCRALHLDPIELLDGPG